MDIILMQLAIAEVMTFPNIPISVTINEYVELAKLYSTRKSGGYINGMLDSIARHLIDTGRLTKFMEPRPEKKSDPQPKKKAPRKRIEKAPEDEE
jgi:N utilization substance protein B